MAKKTKNINLIFGQTAEPLYIPDNVHIFTYTQNKGLSILTGFNHDIRISERKYTILIWTEKNNNSNLNGNERSLHFLPLIRRLDY